jgi:hypothetical protein
MTNNSAVYWTANDFSLHTMAWSVKSFGGRRFFGPAKKGEDLSIPFKRGRVYVPKSRESQWYDLNMWVLPVTEDGPRDSVLTREEKAHENWRRIIAAVDVEGQFDLTKRWYDGNVIKSATAQAEFVDGDGPDADDGTGFYFSLKLLLADPYFYTPADPIGSGSVTVEGEAPTDHVEITFTGGTNPRLTLPGGNWIQYNGTVGATPVVISSLTGNAKRGSSYVNGMITRSPKHGEMPTLAPGDQNLALTGGGTVSIAYDAAYR